jgi:two-component system phosphate regulon sensor histidine kinase PhoR
MASFDLPINQSPPKAANTRRRVGFLPAEVLADNILWFCRLRWIVIGLLCITEALAAWSQTLLSEYGIHLSPRWPAVCAGVLVVTNIFFLLHGRRLRKSPDPQQAKTNLLLQSISDLAVLTAVVHFVGSVETFVPFAYLFHVVLACIFFPSRLSLAITLLGCALYSTCVAVEHFGGLHPETLYTWLR